MLFWCFWLTFFLAVNPKILILTGYRSEEPKSAVGFRSKEGVPMMELRRPTFAELQAAYRRKLTC